MYAASLVAICILLAPPFLAVWQMAVQGACAKGQQWQWSLQLLQEMALQDVQDTKRRYLM